MSKDDLKCPYCPKDDFKNRKSLSNHLTKNHSKELLDEEMDKGERKEIKDNGNQKASNTF